MKASELRIGNLVESFGTNASPEKWTEISIQHFHLETLSRRPDLFRYIPLSENWLVKAGFEKSNSKHLSFEKNGVVLATEYFIYMNRVKLVHVHQLQNLYFALTGEELIFDL